MPKLPHFSRKLKEERELQEFSQWGLARVAKVSQSMIQRIEGGMDPRLDIAVRLWDALGLSYDTMVSETEE